MQRLIQMICDMSWMGSPKLGETGKLPRGGKRIMVCGGLQQVRDGSMCSSRPEQRLLDEWSPPHQVHPSLLRELMRSVSDCKTPNAQFEFGFLRMLLRIYVKNLWSRLQICEDFLVSLILGDRKWIVVGLKRFLKMGFMKLWQSFESLYKLNDSSINWESNNNSPLLQSF